MFKLFILWFQVRAQEAFVQGQMDTLPMLRGEARTVACISHKAAEVELYRLKAEYRKAKRGPGLKAITV